MVAKICKESEDVKVQQGFWVYILGYNGSDCFLAIHTFDFKSSLRSRCLNEQIGLSNLIFADP